MDDLEYKIVDRVARLLIQDIFGSRYEEDDGIYDMLSKKAFERIDGTFTKEFRDDIAVKVSDSFNKKFVRTKQYRELKTDIGMMEDNLVKSGLKDIIEETIEQVLKRKLSL